MTLVDDILACLEYSEKGKTAEQISKETKIPLKHLWAYLTRLKHLGKIETTDNRQPFYYRSITPEALLSRLYKLMSDKMEPSAELTSDEEHCIDLIDKLLNKKGAVVDES